MSIYELKRRDHILIWDQKLEWQEEYVIENIQHNLLSQLIKKIIPNRKQLPNALSSRQIRKQLLDMKVLNDQWTISKPQQGYFLEKDTDPLYASQNQVQYLMKKFGNMYQNTYSKNLKTENLISPRKRMLPQPLIITKKQSNEQQYKIKKLTHLLQLNLVDDKAGGDNKQVGVDNRQVGGDNLCIEVGRQQKRDKLSFGSIALMELKKERLDFDEDIHNFIYPAASNVNQNANINNNGGNILQQYSASPSQHVHRIVQKSKNHSLNMKRIYSHIGPMIQMQTPQQIYLQNNNENLFQQQYKQNIQQLNFHASLQQQINFQQKQGRFVPESIQLAPLQKNLKRNVSKKQLHKSQVDENAQQQKIMLSIQQKVIFNMQTQEATPFKINQELSPDEEEGDEQQQQQQQSLFDLNCLFKQEEDEENDNDKSIIENKKGILVKNSMKERQNKIYKIRKYHMKNEPEINALGKGYSVYFEQHLINRLQKDKQFSLKISAYRDFIQFINFSNKMYITISEETVKHPIYKAFVGKGNNQMLIRMVIKQRWWWIITDQKDDSNINFVWTQLRKNDVLQQIKSLRIELATSRMQRQTSLISIQQSPQNIQFQNQQFHLSPSSSQISFSSAVHPAIQTIQLPLAQSNGCTIQQSMSTQSLYASQSESTTDESSMLSACNLIISTKQAVKLNKNEQNLRKLVNQQDFTVLNKLLQNRQGRKYDSQAFKSSKAISNIAKEQNYRIQKEASSMKVHNHLQDNFHLSNKKALFYNMRNYYESNQQSVFDFLPLTFHIQEGKLDKEYIKFVNHFNTIRDLANNPQTLTKKEQNIWIVKPGEITNRGFGIKVLSDLDSIEQIIDSNEFHKTGMTKTYIIQKYIEYPLLYYKRKFDIRCYYLLTSTNGYLKGYWYQDGYIRTASKEFTTKNLGFYFITQNYFKSKRVALSFLYLPVLGYFYIKSIGKSLYNFCFSTPTELSKQIRKYLFSGGIIF